MASKPNPAPRTVAQLAALIGKLTPGTVYSSSAALFTAAHPAMASAPLYKGLGSPARGVVRGLTPAQAAQVFGKGTQAGYVAVRGQRITPAQWLQAYALVQAGSTQARANALQAKAAHGRQAQAAAAQAQAS